MRQNFIKRLDRIRKGIDKDSNMAKAIKRSASILQMKAGEKVKNGDTIVYYTLRGKNYVEIATILKLKESTIRVQSKNISDMAYELFGEMFLDTLEGYNDDEGCRQEVEIRIYSLENSQKLFELFHPDFIALLPKGNDHEYSFADVKKESDYLLRRTIEYEKKMLAMYDRDKLGYILKVLCGDTYNLQISEYFSRNVAKFKEENKNR